MKRYEHEDKCGGEYQCRMYECSDGDYVAYADYEKLQADNEKLKEMVMDAGKADHCIGAVYSGMPVSRKAEILLKKALELLQPIRRYVYDIEQALKETK